MTQITDINMLRHHRVDYRPTIDRNGARLRKPRPTAALVASALIGLVVLITDFVA